MTVEVSPAGWTDEQVQGCGDPACQGPSEPEYDDKLRYYACLTCGYEWGYVRVPDTSETCSMGVPEDVRARFSTPAGRPEPVMLQIGRRPE